MAMSGGGLVRPAHGTGGGGVCGRGREGHHVHTSDGQYDKLILFSEKGIKIYSKW